MPSLPTGTVTFLFTDIEGSTRLLHDLGGRYAQVLTEYRQILRTASQKGNGHEVDTQGDAIFIAFPRAKDAVTAAVAAQHAIATHSWPNGVAVRVRMGLHTGEPSTAETGYVGVDVHKAARICAAGHGGQILLSQTTSELTAEDVPQGVSFRDLGEHRLKDLTFPQHLYQVVMAGLSADFPPLRSLNVLPNNLPIQLTSFIGREREMAEVKKFLATARLLTLTGAGGSGKTRLALQVAAEVVDAFPHGVWFVDLVGLSDPTTVPQAVASALGVREASGQPLLAMLADYLRGRHVLLVLDNCEHLVIACSQLADALLRSCLHLRILATSREALGVEGEMTFRVPSLSLPDLQRLPTLEKLTDYEAVRLFAERARWSQSAFTVTSQNAGTVARVCVQLDGIPLALEMAAARVKVLTVEQIATRLDDRFRLLSAGARTALPRHQTLRATMDWSHDLLSEKERCVLRRASVFAGGWTLDAAEAICSGGDVTTSDVLDLLTRLVDKSLVIAEPHGGETRYRLLETVRQYARDRLQEAEETDSMRRRHRDWYLDFAERADRKLHGPDQVMWLERLDTEHDNLRAALEWSRSETDGAEAGLRLAGVLWWFWVVRGRWSEGRNWLERALTRSSDAKPYALPRALQGAAYLAWRKGDHERTTALCERGLALCRELNEKANRSLLFVWLANVASTQQHYEQAESLLKHGIPLAQECGDKWAAIVGLSSLGGVARGQRDYARAIALHLEALAVAKESGDIFEIAYQLRQLATDTLRQGNFEQATTYYAESLALCQDLGKRWTVQECLDGLAEATAGRGCYERAARLLGAAEALRESLGPDRSSFGQIFHDKCVASTHERLGDPAFEVAWAAGRAMTLEQAVEYALREAE